jgi:hypothetical protein
MKIEIHRILILSSLFMTINATMNVYTQDLTPRKLSPDGTVFDMQRKGETLYLAGDFNRVGYLTGGAALFNQGVDDPDLDFPYIEGEVYEIIPDGTGGWFIGGEFDRVIDLNIRNLVHILPDMTIDEGFIINPNNKVNALALHNNILYIGGKFTQIDGTLSPNLAAYDLNADALMTFDVQVNLEVTDLLIYENFLIMGGWFSTVNGITHNRLAKVDLSTQEPVSFPSVQSGYVNRLLVKDDILYVGGGFNSNVNWNTFSENRRNLFAVDLTDTVVTDWAPVVSGFGFGQRVNALAAIGDTIYFGGSFSQVDGEARVNLAAVTKQGALLDFSPDPSAEIFALAGINNKLWVGGDFTQISSTELSFAAILDPGSGIPDSWDMQANWAAHCFEGNENYILTGGEFMILKYEERENACAFDLVSGELLDWNPQGGFLVGSGLLVDEFNDVVYLYGWDSNTLINIKAFHSITGENLPNLNIQVDNWVYDMIQNPKTGDIYFSGDFETAKNENRKKIAAVDTSGNLLPFSVEADGIVRTMAILDTVLYFGGRFNNVNAQSRFKAAAVTLNGDLLPWFPEHNILIQSTDIVIQYALQDKIIISGSFSKIGNDDRNKIAAVDPVSGSVLPWDPDPEISSFTKLFVEGDGIFLSGNGMQSLSGTVVYNLAYVSLQSGLPLQVFPNFGFLNTFSMETFNNTLYFGGSFRNLERKYYPFFASISFQDFNTRGQIESVSPSKGGNTGDVTMEITGTGLIPGTMVSLGIDGTEVIFPMAGSTKTFNNTLLTSTFDLRGETPGTMDVIIDIPGDTIYIFEDEFEIEVGTESMPWAEMIAPAFVTTNKEELFYLTFGNNGNVDAVGVPLWMAVSPNIEVTEFGLPVDEFTDPGAEYYDSIPEYVLIDTLLGEAYQAKVYAYLIPRIPAGSSTTVAVRIIGESDGDFYTRAWVNEPMYGSPLKHVVGDCLDSYIGNAIGVIPYAGCAYGMMDVFVSPWVDPIYDPDYGSSGYVGSYFQMVAETAFGCGLDIFTGPVGRPIVKIIENSLKAKSLIDYADKCFMPGDGEDQNGQFVASCDPNDKTGPTGQGAMGWLTTDRTFPYLIRFENEEDATAPAKRVIIRDTLDLTVFDPESLELKAFYIGDKSFTIPPAKKEYDYTVDLRPGVDALVNLNVQLDPVSGELVWIFTGIDPATGEEFTHPLDGFLPPNTDEVTGQGGVMFDIQPYDTVSTGRMISNMAAIYFDFNDPIITNNWILHADNDPPSGHILALPDTQQTSSFMISWEGSDSGSGIRCYDILYRLTGEEVWKYAAFQTKETSLIFNGTGGHEYEFYARAYDNALNKEVLTGLREAATYVPEDANVGIEEGETVSLQVYPVPAVDILNLKLNTNQSPLEVRIIDLNGRTCYTESIKDQVNEEISINIEGLAAGIYILEWRSDENTGKVKVIKK